MVPAFPAGPRSVQWRAVLYASPGRAQYEIARQLLFTETFTFLPPSAATGPNGPAVAFLAGQRAGGMRRQPRYNDASVPICLPHCSRSALCPAMYGATPAYVRPARSTRGASWNHEALGGEGHVCTARGRAGKARLPTSTRVVLGAPLTRLHRSVAKGDPLRAHGGRARAFVKSFPQ